MHTQESVAYCKSKEGCCLGSNCTHESTWKALPQTSQEAIGISISQEYYQTTTSIKNAIDFCPSSQSDISHSPCSQVSPEYPPNMKKVMDSTYLPKRL